MFDYVSLCDALSVATTVRQRDVSRIIVPKIVQCNAKLTTPSGITGSNSPKLLDFCENRVYYGCGDNMSDRDLLEFQFELLRYCVSLVRNGLIKCLSEDGDENGK